MWDLAHSNSSFLTSKIERSDTSELQDFLNKGKFSYQIEYHRYHHVMEYLKNDLHWLDQFDYKIGFILHGKNIVGHPERPDDIWWASMRDRIDLLQRYNFKIALNNLWECNVNMQNYLYHQIFLKKFKDIDYYLLNGGDVFYWWMTKHQNPQPLKVDHSSKKFDFLYLNKMKRGYRLELWKECNNHNLLDNSLATFLQLDPKLKLPEEYEEEWMVELQKQGHDGWSYDQGDDNNLVPFTEYYKINTLPYQHTTCSIVSETHADGREAYVTEKTWKPIMCEHLFVIHGPIGHLEHLRKLGFKTFSDWWDESYDLIDDPIKRIETIVQTCLYIKTLDPMKLYKETKDIRKHNIDLFHNKYGLAKAIRRGTTGVMP